MALCTASLIAAGGWSDDRGLAVGDAWVRASIAGSKVSAAYFMLSNRGAAAVRLVGVRAERAGHAMLHRSAIEDGMVKMRHVEAMEIPPGGELAFEPGGLHVMLTGIVSPLKPGERISLTLVFESAGELVISVPVRTAAPPG